VRRSTGNGFGERRARSQYAPSVATVDEHQADAERERDLEDLILKGMTRKQAEFALDLADGKPGDLVDDGATPAG
jgi:hypothetical protein